MIILFGLAGSGKGTQAKALSEFFGWRTFSVGQVIRDTGEYAQIIDDGGLIPDDDVIRLMNKQIEIANAEGYDVILDGYPRTEYQAKWMMEHMADDIDGAIIIEVPKEELYERLELRAREDDLNKESITAAFDSLYSDKTRTVQMGRKAKSVYRTDCLDIIYSHLFS